MKPCMESRHWKNRRVFTRVLYLIIFCWILSIAIFVAIEGETSIRVFVPAFFMLVDICLLSYFVVCDVVEGRKYCADKNGITISYCKRVIKFYPWRMFQRIVVCDFDHATKYPQNCFLIIRLSTLEEPLSDFSANRRKNNSSMEPWRRYRYTMKRFRKIIFLGFSPKVLDEIQGLSNLPVVYSLTKFGEDIYQQNMIDKNWGK